MVCTWDIRKQNLKPSIIKWIATILPCFTTANSTLLASHHCSIHQLIIADYLCSSKPRTCDGAWLERICSRSAWHAVILHHGSKADRPKYNKYHVSKVDISTTSIYQHHVWSQGIYMTCSRISTRCCVLKTQTVVACCRDALQFCIQYNGADNI